MKLESVRREYKRAALSKHSIDKNPFAAFDIWMKDALEWNRDEATAVSVCTHGTDGFPQSRIVLLKDYDDQGFVFFTNYNSEKGQAIESDARVSLHFFWPELERQIRISGHAEKTVFEQSEAYFRSRPLDSQIAALVSQQSSEVPSREYLEKQFEAQKAALAGHAPDCPKYWGGYRVSPVKFEFWQGRENRLHDRLVYKKVNNLWKIIRLAP